MQRKEEKQKERAVLWWVSLPARGTLGVGGGGEDPSCPSRLQRDEGWRDGETKGCVVWLEDYVRAVQAEEEP